MNEVLPVLRTVADDVRLWALIRINREYRREAAALERLPVGADRPRAPPPGVLLVETLDLAALKALRYAHELQPETVRAVHFAIDEAHARRLSALWASTSATSVELELVGCPDHRLRHAMRELAMRTTQDGNTSLTCSCPVGCMPTAWVNSSTEAPARRCRERWSNCRTPRSRFSRSTHRTPSRLWRRTSCRTWTETDLRGSCSILMAASSPS
ncbi:hypothetical protein [Streptomyces sp. NPDC088180]|uniref:hypothetical protein n=1 Tax=Streptomyces sp. NPDC088180 TaxID=3365837 RepID=UPI00380135ED